MKPYNVNVVADYIICSLNADENFSLINLKLQKLVYYVQAWSLGINKKRFIKEDFQAWVHGPVCRALYDRLKDDKSLYSIITINDVKNNDFEKIISAEDAAFINYILENYARFSGSELEAMTHSEDPWKMARGNCSPLERCENIITEESIMSFYGKKYEEINS